MIAPNPDHDFDMDDYKYKIEGAEIDLKICQEGDPTQKLMLLMDKGINKANLSLTDLAKQKSGTVDHVAKRKICYNESIAREVIKGLEIDKKILLEVDKSKAEILKCDKEINDLELEGIKLELEQFELQ
mgnify:FL=1